MTNQNNWKIIQGNISLDDEYGTYDGLSSKIYYKFRSNLNLPDVFALHHWISIQFNDFFIENGKITILAYDLPS